MSSLHFVEEIKKDLPVYLKKRSYDLHECSSHVSLNLFKGLRKRDKMQGLPTTVLLFRNKFNIINNT